ncbi:MAG: glycosyltransferase family 2 protein [Candidatus Zixiibacteriota bacterium]|nr:MAG: glycosyltransferase family 2 protein [candidate division Zixibacteria bacterium]
MPIAEIIFWLSILGVFWAYFGYWLMLKLMSMIHTRTVRKEDFQPQISLIITAYNEERRIREKIENTLALDYPRDKLEIIVVSDASTDGTEDIVRSFADRGVKLLVIGERHGKHHGQGRGIRMAKSDIVVLTDATTFLDRDGVSKIIRNFADPTIGCVSSEDRMKSSASNASGEGLYVTYEMQLRSAESAVGSLVGVSGSFYAVRKHLCEHWIDNMSSDFYMPSVAKINGYRTVLEPEALGYYEVVRDPEKEFIRKVRTVVHGYEVLFRFFRVLNPFKYGFYSLQMFSHKLCRWLVPLFLISALISNLFLWQTGILYQMTLLTQLALYLMALLAHLVKRLQDVVLFKVPFFFAMVNISILVAWYKYLTGQEYVVWDATKR